MRQGIILGAAITTFAVVIPAAAQQAPSFPHAQMVVATTPQPTDEEVMELRRCVRMTPAHQAQSSQCTGLIKKFDLAGLMREDRARQDEITGRSLYLVTHPVVTH